MNQHRSSLTFSNGTLTWRVDSASRQVLGRARLASRPRCCLDKQIPLKWLASFPIHFFFLTYSSTFFVITVPNLNGKFIAETENETKTHQYRRTASIKHKETDDGRLVHDARATPGAKASASFAYYTRLRRARKPSGSCSRADGAGRFFAARFPRGGRHPSALLSVSDIFLMRRARADETSIKNKMTVSLPASNLNSWRAANRVT